MAAIAKLTDLIGLTVVDIDLPDGDFSAGIRFENEAAIGIHNDYETRGFSRSSAQELVGRSIKAVSEDSAHISITFDNDWRIEIDMSDEGYSGPEAVELHVPRKFPTIWN